MIMLHDAAATKAHGAQIARSVRGGEVVYLSGQLGSGKTTWVRGFLSGLGYTGHVKSPTYTLVEPYEVNCFEIYHFDLYRINNPDELDAMGIRDYCDGQSICLIEWPELGKGVLPKADIAINMAVCGTQRKIYVHVASSRGETMIFNA